MSIFEQASRRKLRFETALGPLATEDLWFLPLSKATEPRNRHVALYANLNDIAITLHEKIQSSAVSFVDSADKVDADLQLRFDIIKHIIDVRLKERDEAKEAAAKAERKQKLMGILARKQDAELEGMSVEQIRELIDAT
jgi:hypothetical protein